ncbi:MAG: hypothetical protein ACKVI4_09890 [Actinomycetales bacterium]
MLLTDFDSHPLWNVLDAIDGQLQEIVDAHQPEELAEVERIRVQQAYVRSFRVVASTRVAFFHPMMLDSVHNVWNQVHNALSNRIVHGVGHSNFVSQAASESETALMQMAPWPRHYGKGGEVKQMNSLFEQLLEAQRESIEALRAEHSKLREEMAEYAFQIDSKKSEVNASLEGTEVRLSELDSTIDGQKAELSTAVDAAKKAVVSLTDANSKAYAKWKDERESEFLRDFDPLKQQIGEKLSSAGEQYEELIGAKAKYTKLVSAIAADEVASQFEVEAAWGRKAGNRFYLLGFAFLLVAAAPLTWLIFEGSQAAAGEVNWNAIIVRLAIGVLAGSAATVAIRLGGRLINNANAIKRMELELRAIGPFLANVAEKPKVDNAFVDLVAKAFGNTYAATASTGGKDTQDEKTSVSAAAQLFEVFEKIRQANPPTT